jgi:hypothetical protein
MKGSANEYLDRLRDEFTQLHTQLQNSRMEIEKFSQEKEAVQRHYMMYYELACGLNVEWHKQVEVVKRLSGILNQIIPLLPPEHQASAIAAVERAKQINPQVRIAAVDCLEAKYLGSPEYNGIANATTTTCHVARNG